MERKYAEFAATKACELLAIDSPSGYTRKAATWVKEAFEALGFAAKITTKGGVLADLGGDISRQLLHRQRLFRSISRQLFFFHIHWAYLLSFYGTGAAPVSGGRSRSGNKNAPLHAARKPPFPRAQNRAFLLLFCGKKRLKKALCRSSQRKRRTQLLLLSDPPRRAFGLDYDPGPLFCVHLLGLLKNLTYRFIIAP